MVNINIGDNVVLGHDRSSNDPGTFKKFSFYTCMDIEPPNEYVLHGKYEDSDHVAVRYDRSDREIEILKDSSFLKRRDAQEVMYCDTFDSEHRYFVFVDGTIEPRLTALGPNKLHTEVHGDLDGTSKFAFRMSSNSFIFTRQNDFRPLTNKDNNQVHSTDEIPFSFSCSDNILLIESEDLITSLQVA